MSVIVSERTLVNMEASWWPTTTGGSISLYNGFTKDYATLYKEQPNVRTCVDFLARNIAQLGLHIYRKDEDKGRIRLRDHPIAILLGRPLPNKMKFTRYRMIESVMSDLGIYGNAFLKKEIRDDGVLEGLVRLPPVYVTVKGSLYPNEYKVDFGAGNRLTYDAEEVIHFRSYNSESAVKGLSPLETLRRTLAEEHAAALYREKYWQNSARMNGVLQRPANAPDWSDAARQRFKKEWQALYSGVENSGKTAILEEGMEFKSTSFNPKDSEYLEGRKLTREECARAYHIPPPLVGILDHATYSNIESQHRSLYTDVLGPWLAMIEEDLQLQLLNNFADTDGVYLEFNIQEKMTGDFETQIRSLQSATGTAYMTVNEAREIMNLPKIEGADELVVPLNVLVGGQASPTDSAPKGQRPVALGTALKGPDVPQLEAERKEIESFDMQYPGLREIYDEKWRSLLVKTFERQQNAILPQIGKGKIASQRDASQSQARNDKKDIELIWDVDRWNNEVTADFTPLSMQTALAWAQTLGKALGVVITEETMQKYIDENARIAAEYMNESTRLQIEEALTDEDPKSAVQRVFQGLLAVTVARFAIGRVTSLSNYGAYKAAVKGGITTKTWVVNSTNPRDSHAAMNGETVGIYDRFSNGMRWPGDYEGSAAETVNCECSLRYNRENPS